MNKKERYDANHQVFRKNVIPDFVIASPKLCPVRFRADGR